MTSGVSAASLSKPCPNCAENRRPPRSHAGPGSAQPQPFRAALGSVSAVLRAQGRELHVGMFLEEGAPLGPLQSHQVCSLPAYAPEGQLSPLCVACCSFGQCSPHSWWPSCAQLARVHPDGGTAAGIAGQLQAGGGVGLEVTTLGWCSGSEGGCLN